MWDQVYLGLSVALSPEGLFFCLLGVTLGTFIGVLPGVGVLSTVSLLLPLTFYLDGPVALIMLAGIYYGGAYGGSITSILLNIPGSSSAAVTCLDGYPMARQGRAGVALFITAIASFFGSMVGTVVLVAFSVPLAHLALRFGAAEYFSLMILGLFAASALSTGGVLRAVPMIVVGLMLGIVGTDINSGVARFTFGQIDFNSGLSLVALALGLFGLPEVILNVANRERPTVTAKNFPFRSMLPTREDWRRSFPSMLRGTGVGALFGVLPGAGGMISSFLSYAVERQSSRHPEEFGHGAIEGVVGPEAANNAGVQTAFIPTLSLGIPGDPIMALMLGALIIHGIIPGPLLVTEHPDVFWGLIFSFAIGNIILLVLNIPLIGIWTRILSIPYTILYPGIIVFICIGVYSVSSSLTDLWVAIGFGCMGFAMRLFRFEPAPLLLGFVLGPSMEEYLRRALLLSRGDFMTFLERPFSAAFLAATLALLCLVAWRAFKTGQQSADEA